MHLASDDDAFVRMQVAYSSAFLRAADSAQALAALMQSDGGNAHIEIRGRKFVDAENVMLVMHELKQTSARVLMPWIDCWSNAATLADADD